MNGVVRRRMMMMPNANGAIPTDGWIPSNNILVEQNVIGSANGTMNYNSGVNVYRIPVSIIGTYTITPIYKQDRGSTYIIYGNLENSGNYIVHQAVKIINTSDVSITISTIETDSYIYVSLELSSSYTISCVNDGQTTVIYNGQLT